MSEELREENKRLREERLAFAIECVDLWWLLTRVQIHMGVKRLPNELMRDIRKKMEGE